MILKFFYKNLLKKILFLRDPEKVHNRFIKIGKFLGDNSLFRKLIKSLFYYENKKLEQSILGIKFSNPVGLAAGFDKDAELTDILPSLGFGFEEVGSITGEFCPGNPKPRLWRLKKSKALVVYYGLKSLGRKRIFLKLKHKQFRIPIGISIARTNIKKTVPLQAGIDDYVNSFRTFSGVGDYFTINISCPNTCGGEPFTNSSNLDKLLDELDKIYTKHPIFLKLSPDLSNSELDRIIELSYRHRIHGFICSNLSKKRNFKLEENIPKNGGISGKVVEDKANNMIKYLYSKTKGNFVIIGVGGIFSAEDAYKKIKLGSSLVQLITGMVFEGPQLIKEINRGLVRLLEEDGFSNISEVVGKNQNY